MVNIIAGKKIVPEYIQNWATVKSITNNAIEVINDTKKRAIMKSELLNVHKKLGDSGATIRAAEYILRAKCGREHIFLL